jgi:hypothetical protein
MHFLDSPATREVYPLPFAFTTPRAGRFDEKPGVGYNITKTRQGGIAMSDAAHDFPALEAETGITATEREEIRAHIEKVATENRLPVEASQFALHQARRGVLLPAVVNVSALVAVVLAAVVLSLVFRRGEQRVQTQASQYASIEGRLIRELRAESSQMISSKQKEIEEVRQRLRDLEQQQRDLEQTFTDKLKAKEEEYRVQLKQEVDAERARLLTRGVGQAELEPLLKKYEAERKAYYDQQLAAYRRSLEAERNQLQTDINKLRSEYTTRLQQLENDQRQIVADYEKREATLRVQLDQKTQVMDRLRAQNVVSLDSAQKQLTALTQAREKVNAIENQIDGLSAQVMQAVSGGDTASALERVKDLQAFLRQDTVRALPTLSGRLRTELFLLNQLQLSLEQRLSAESSAAAQSLTSELELLGQIRRLSQEAARKRDPAAQLEVYRRIIASMPELKTASDALSQDAVKGAVEKERAEVAAAQVPAAGAGDSGAASSTDDRAARSQEVAVLEARYKAENARQLDAIAARARTTRQDLDKRIDRLNASDDQLTAARAAFSAYVTREAQAKSANPADAMTASRQELNRFLRDDSVRKIFSDIADHVNALYTATQTAGSSAALADAAEIVADVARQPTLKAQRLLLQHELSSAKADPSLTSILTSLDEMLAKEEAAAAP